MNRHSRENVRLKKKKLQTAYPVYIPLKVFLNSKMKVGL